MDAPLRTRLRQEMLALPAEIATTTLLGAHDPAEAMLLANGLLLLEDGHVLQSGPVEAVFDHPGQPVAPGPCRLSIDPAAIQVWPA